MNRKLIGVLAAFLALGPIGVAEAMPNAMTPGTARTDAPLSSSRAGPETDGSTADGATVEKTYYRRYCGYRRYYRYRPYYRPYYRHYYHRRFYRPYFYRPYFY